MGDLVVLRPYVPAMPPPALENVRRMERMAATLPQVPILTDHVIHAGLYSRTVHLPAGVMITGALIKIATLLMVCGEAMIYVGTDSPITVVGFNVLPASAGRKQAIVSVSDVALTMVFPTLATTVEGAEAEFTDETDLLMSRLDPRFNRITITGQ